MKIVVIGGTGLIRSKLVVKLGEHGNSAVPAAPNSEGTLVPGRDAQLGKITYDTWLAQQ